MNLLIIEDDIFLANKIKQIFEKKIISNRVNILTSFDEFTRKIYLINSYDIVLVDILL
jgi:response regulator of citrate/malate metabolism